MAAMISGLSSPRLSCSLPTPRAKWTRQQRLLLSFALGALLITYCEVLHLLIVVSKCHWPTLGNDAEEDGVKVMAISDLHFKASRAQRNRTAGGFGEWLDQRRENQIRFMFTFAANTFLPHLIFVLGDHFDVGTSLSKDEASFNYLLRLKNLLAVTKVRSRFEFALGNHDVRRRWDIPSYFEEIYNKLGTRKQEPVRHVEVKGVDFLVLDSASFMLLNEEESEKILSAARDRLLLKAGKKARPIVLQHVPLNRTLDDVCLDHGSYTIPERTRIFEDIPYTLPLPVSLKILELLRPRLVIDGHLHSNCVRNYPITNTQEWTISTFGRKNDVWCNCPSFLLMQATSNGHAIIQCKLPRDSTVHKIYLLGLGVLISLWLPEIASAFAWCLRFC